MADIKDDNANETSPNGQPTSKDTDSDEYFGQVRDKPLEENSSVHAKLYQRLTCKLIPPLHQSIHNFYTDSNATIPSIENSEESEGTKHLEVDDDVANTDDIMKPQKNLLDIIASSQIYSDVFNFVNQRSRSDSKASKLSSNSRKSEPRALGYGIVDYSSDEESGHEDTEDENLAGKMFGSHDSPYDSHHESGEDQSANDSDEFQDAEDNTDSFSKDEATLTTGVMQQSETTSDLMNNLNIDDDEPINYDELTPFQQSIIKNLEFHYDGGVLMKQKFKSDFESLDNVNDDKALKVKLRIAERLQKVFKINDDDCFYSGYSTWLVRDVFLQGHIYLTRDSLLYFAFLPDKNSDKEFSSEDGEFSKHDDSNFYIQAGALTMKTKKYGEILSTVLTTRFWAILRNETLSIYSNATDLYFPNLVIDLRTCTKVEILDKYQPNVEVSTPNIKNNKPIDSPGIQSPREAMSRRNSNEDLMNEEEELTKMLAQEAEENKDSVSGGVWFKITTNKKSYKFQTDNMFSAREWVNNITKLMFQIHNSNSRNEVLIKIPFDKILKYDRRNMFSSNDSKFDDDLPSSFCVIYKGSESPLNKVYQKFNEKTKSKMGIAPEIDMLIFAFFAKSDQFYEAFTKVLKDREASDSLSTTSSQSSKNDTSSVVSPVNAASKLMSKIRRKKYPDYNEVISTLTHGGNSSNIVNQITSVNKELSDFNMLSNNVESSSKLKKISKSISSKVFTSRNKSNHSPTNMYQDLSSGSLTASSTLVTPLLDSSTNSLSSSPSTSHLVSPTESMHGESISPNNLNLPRQLSLTGLKNLNMSFETSKKKLQVAEQRYEDTLREEKKMGDVTTDSKGETVPLDIGLQLKSPLPVTPILPGPLNLTDPSDYKESDSKKENKLKYLGKSVKSLGHVSSMWNANPNHYIKLEENDPFFIEDASAREVGDKHFRSHFSLPDNSKLAASYFCHFQRALPVYGKLYVGDEMVCFRSLLPGVSTKMILPLRDVENCYKSKATKITYSCLVIVLKGRDKLVVEFSNQKSRDDCSDTILEMLHLYHGSETWEPMAHEWGINYDLELGKQRLDNDHQFGLSFKPSDETLRQASLRIESARVKLFEDRFNAAAGIQVPIVLEDSPFTKTEIRPSTSYNFVLLTIGSRGDVQPYIALAKGLMKEGHNVTIATHSEFQEWVEKHGINFKEIAGDPTELMSLMVSHGSMSVAFIKEASVKFKGWISELLATSWQACQGADILIESPSAMGGVHIAEALGIPYMRAFTMPWTRTRAYSHAFILPDQKKGGSYNYLTHVMFENVFWKGISSQVNKWRVQSLNLPKTNLFKLQQGKVPFLYNVSQAVLPPAVDFPDWVKVTGYWFLDEGGNERYKPPPELVKFIERASIDQKKIVYIGFGSIVVSDAKSLTEAVIEAVQEADVRCILNKGWSDRLSKDKNELELELPPEIYNSGAIPHDWLFPRIDAAVHHGGSGTTGATLRSGLPTIIKPFFGDQFFYASRVEEIGVGISLRKLNSKSLSKALLTATTDIKMIEKAKKVSEQICNEFGVLSAIEAIYSELEYARSLIINKQLANEKSRLSGYKSGTQTPQVPTDLDMDTESDSDLDDDLSPPDSNVLRETDFKTVSPEPLGSTFSAT
ncbi:sterol 3-beta-glucosyltransferase [[Candida] jaroonii]|uniref:Sterol 3-beta-glucosyltransferase n=1 Tax=[Candida] jaroonii TaxID=467808 RepID=A0ACA9YAQ7_9ASCO|nr:sterol 3-beta-glucosyltransferase [[Candida] jaroonii]